MIHLENPGRFALVHEAAFHPVGQLMSPVLHADIVGTLPTVVKLSLQDFCGQSPTPDMVELLPVVASPPTRGYRALPQLRANIAELMYVQGVSQTALALQLSRSKSWINKFLNGTREVQLKDLDRLADFFGLSVFELFLPGISKVTDRRKGADRRSGKERRLGHAARLARRLADSVERPTSAQAKGRRGRTTSDS